MRLSEIITKTQADCRHCWECQEIYKVSAEGLTEWHCLCGLYGSQNVEEIAEEGCDGFSREPYC